jgi:hypothetical protein
MEARRAAVVDPQEAAHHRCGSSSSMQLAGCIGGRSSKSVKYA